MYYYDPTYILMIPAIIFTLWAQFKVKSAYSRYRNVPNRNRITGYEAAQKIMRANGIDIPIEVIAGQLTDHFDPSARVLRLSSEVANGYSVASVAIAAHEVGHALQHAQGYVPIKIRGTIVPVANISSTLAWPLIIIGLVMGVGAGHPVGDTILNIGLILFLAVVAFHLVTLPVELNASRRALTQIEGLGIVDYEEKKGAKKVLKAAAMTYVAALAVAVLQLVRILAIVGSRRD